MSKIWLRIKLGILAIVFAYVLTFCIINWYSKLKLWVWYKTEEPTNALILSAGCFVAGVIATLFIRTTLVTIRQLKDMKERNRQDRLHRDVAEMKAKAAMIQPRPAESASAPDEKSLET